jgi:hypothetical protein
VQVGETSLVQWPMLTGFNPCGGLKRLDSLDGSG